MILPCIPYCPRREGTVPEPGLDLGYAINETMERLRPDDWAFILDHDLSFPLPQARWGRRLETAIAKKPDAGFFTCYRWPASKRKPWLQPREITRRSYDMRYHRDIAVTLDESYGDELQDVTKWETLPGGSPGAGIFLLSRRAWEEVGEFKHGFKKEGIDYDYHERTRAAGLRCFLMKGVYCMHAKEL